VDVNGCLCTYVLYYHRNLSNLIKTLLNVPELEHEWKKRAKFHVECSDHEVCSLFIVDKTVVCITGQPKLAISLVFHILY
jgi:hypothetical protein